MDVGLEGGPGYCQRGEAILGTRMNKCGYGGLDRQGGKASCRGPGYEVFLERHGPAAGTTLHPQLVWASFLG